MDQLKVRVYEIISELVRHDISHAEFISLINEFLDLIKKWKVFKE